MKPDWYGKRPERAQPFTDMFIKTLVAPRSPPADLRNSVAGRVAPGGWLVPPRGLAAEGRRNRWWVRNGTWIIFVLVCLGAAAWAWVRYGSNMG